MDKKSLEILGYYEILERLANCAYTDKGKEKIREMKPLLSEIELKKNLNETSQAKNMIEFAGMPPLPSMENTEEYIKRAIKGDLLMPHQFEEIGLFLNAVNRLKSYLKKGEERQIGIAFYNENLVMSAALKEEIERCIRGGRIDDYASSYLKDIRKQIRILSEKISEKADRVIKANKSYLSDSFVVTRNGRICIPVKKEYKSMIIGSVIDKSSTGATLFIEPKAVAEIGQELDILKIEEDTEERRILYFLTNMVAENEKDLFEDTRVIELLDFIFAKGKLSLEINGVEPEINTDNYINIKGAKHPMLEQEICVPLDFQMGKGINGVIITGPNTGGKTVAIKTVGLMSAMACSGLHVPCKEAHISMQNQILCDIGDGQSISDNLSTFSSHIKNVLRILKKMNGESLVIMDELGSGTDPTEGMGIAISILEELRKSGVLFLVTTHYPEVKEYAGRYREIINARMEFDKESLKPLYKLKVGEAGESCALYIAKHLGFPREMIRTAALEAYGLKGEEIIKELKIKETEKFIKKESANKIVKKLKKKENMEIEQKFSTGDSVMILPDNQIGIVVKPADKNGDVLVQIKKEKILFNYKRLKLKVAASELYPEDYDFSIIFDTVENRKARHKMGKGHQEGIVINVEE